jgi:hypothetical protein
MDIGSILFLLALLILIGLFIARPLFDRDAPGNAHEDDQTEHEVSTLLAEQDRVLNALQLLNEVSCFNGERMSYANWMNTARLRRIMTWTNVSRLRLLNAVQFRIKLLVLVQLGEPR